MSRWMIPFWWACWTPGRPGRTAPAAPAASAGARRRYLVIGTPLTSSMTKYGRPLSVVPASSTLAMLGWSISARACRSASKRARTCRLVHARLDDLERDLRLDRLGLLGHVDDAHAPFADLLAAACTGRCKCQGIRQSVWQWSSRRQTGMLRGSFSPLHKPEAVPRAGAWPLDDRRRPLEGRRAASSGAAMCRARLKISFSSRSSSAMVCPSINQGGIRAWIP